jgi:uncharacterized protein YcfL
MRNLFIIKVLCVFQCACSTQIKQPQQSRTLLEFSDLAGEIAVSRETLASTSTEPQADTDDPADTSR